MILAMTRIGRDDTRRGRTRWCLAKPLLAAAVSTVLVLAATADPYGRGGALFEPPDGRIYHGTAPNPIVVEGYVDALDDRAIEPLIEGIHLGAAGTAGRQYVVDTIREWLGYVREAGRIPHLSLSMTDGHGNPSDVAIATTAEHDAVLREIAAVVAEYGDPLFVRFGFEFNGAWNGYTPGVYPIAYRKMVDIFRDAGVVNAAYVWCYEPDAPGDFDAVVDGRSAWYPGDGYVDWFGLDLFGAEHFDPAFAGRPGRETAYDKSIRFLEMAAARGKPVILSETAPVKVYLTPDADDPRWVDGRADWEAWYAKYFAFMADHPQIKAFLYMNHDYRGTHWESANGWGDCRIETNGYVLDRYRDVLRQPRFIHLDEGLVVD